MKDAFGELPWGDGEIPRIYSALFSIIFSEFNGAKFNWHLMKFEEAK